MSDVDSVSPREAIAHCRNGAIILDIREEYVNQFKRFDVAKVVQIPLSRLAADSDGIPRDQLLVVADSSGLHGKEAVAVLQEKGFVRLAVLAGGFVEWERDGMPVVTNTTERLSGSCACQLRARNVQNPDKT